MRRISSRLTFTYKRVLPTILFGFFAIFVAFPFVYVWAKAGVIMRPPVPFSIVSIVIGAGLYFFFKRFVFDLVDEALDDGDALVVRKGGRRDRIALADINGVSYTALLHPCRVTLSLRKPSVFGDKVSFCAPIRFIPFLSHPMINEWIERIDAVREGRWRPMQSQAPAS